MSAQMEPSRGWRRGFVAALVILLFKVIIDVNVSQLREVRIRAQHEEAEASQRAAAARASDAAQAVQSQVTDGMAPQFALDADVRVVEGVSSLVLSVPATWDEQESYTDELAIFEPDAYSGLLEAGVVPDLCLSVTSPDDARRHVASVIESISFVGDASWSGAQRQALWYRYPIMTVGSNRMSYSHGFLEIVLSGRDVYYLIALCEATEYTTGVQDEMLRVLNSASVPDEAPLLNDHTAEGDAASDGVRRARDLAGEGVMADFLMSLGDFRALEFDGTGDSVVSIPRSADAVRHPCFCLITATYEGVGRFAVKRVGEPGGEGVVLIDRSGPYHGVVTNLGVVGETIVQDKLEVTAEGDWSISLAPLADTPVLENGAAYTGDALVFMDEDALANVRCTYEGSGDFSVYAAGYDGSELLVDTTGPCDETVAWDDPHTLYVVHADGDWSLSW